MDTNNKTMLVDFYELTMAAGYFNTGLYKKTTYFDLFFRRVPDNGGFAIAAGLEQLVKYIENLKFTEDDIAFLRSKAVFDEDFLSYLKTFKFTGDIYAVKEGTPIFPNQPIITVVAPAIEAQIIETYALLTINHQSLIATKANRIVRAANGLDVLEFGARRAHGANAALLGARAAYIGGCVGSSCTLADMLYGVPSSGTMAHSWVQMFDSEYKAFKEYCTLFPDNPTLLVDTYNTLESGVPNAIKVFNEILVPKGIKNCAIRLDSGDISYLSKKARVMLDNAGFENCKIVASNSLDEYIIKDLISQGAKIDIFAVGENLITSKSSPVFGGVYKLVAAKNNNGDIVPKIKISDNIGKITNPHFKKSYRLYDKRTDKALADLLCVYNESLDNLDEITIFDPEDTWKRKTIKNFYSEETLIPIFKNGEKVYDLPNINEIRKHCKNSVNRLWDEVKRFKNPHKYYVDLSQNLWDIKNELLQSHKFQ